METQTQSSQSQTPNPDITIDIPPWVAVLFIIFVACIIALSLMKESAYQKAAEEFCQNRSMNFLSYDSASVTCQGRGDLVVGKVVVFPVDIHYH
jgi:hypothetical protein